MGEGGSTLLDGAVLDGRWCQGCGGVLLPAAGSDRVLHQLLALDRASLMELANGFGGRRFACPWCTARMRCLVVRGVDVDLCFHCGGLWLEHGELERLSGQRYSSPTPTRKPAHAIAIRADTFVRFDARQRLPSIVGAGIRAVGLGVLGAAALLPSSWWLPGTALAGAATAVVVGTALARRRVVDVFPRARRLLRSRAWLPTSARDDQAEPLDDKAVVVVRTLVGGVLASADYVDSCGRVLAPITMGRSRTVAAAAALIARRLGCRVVDGRVTVGADADPPPWSLVGDKPTVLRRQPGPAAFIQVEARREGRSVMTIKNAVPARGDDDRLSLCFYADVGGTAVVRLHDDGMGHVVFVGDNGAAIASAWRQRLLPGIVSRCTISAAVGPARLHLLELTSGGAVVLDDDGRRQASFSMLDGALLLTTLRPHDDTHARLTSALALLLATRL